jgi:membrane protease YdiL (CAAX protease family)
MTAVREKAGDRGHRARPHPLLIFFVLTFSVAWLAWLPAAAESRGLIRSPVPRTVAWLVGAFSPTLVAVGLTLISEGGRGLRRLLRGLLKWRVHVAWYGFVLLWPAALSLAATGVSVVFGSPTPDFSHPPFTEEYPLPLELGGIAPWSFIPLVFLQYLLISSPMGEEIGWRGYALPRLQSSLTALSASMVLGVVWGVWHLPLALTRGHPISDGFFGWFVLGIVADAVLFTWLYNSTGGSLLLAVLFHTSIAVTGLFVSSATSTPLPELVLKWIAVGAVVAVFGAANLSRAEKQQVSVRPVEPGPDSVAPSETHGAPTNSHMTSTSE